MTEVNLKQNETLAISGLVKQNNSEAITKVKFLGDIPILGRLFRSETFRNNKSELVVFITPQVYDPTSEENIKRVARATEMRKTFLQNIDSSEEILD
jgi:pilus assembly protein CpaC